MEVTVIALFGHVPARLVGVALIGAGLVALLAASLGWHALRRLFGIPRIPRGRWTYVLMVALWGGLVALCGGTLAIARMLRDHQPVDGRTPLAEVRCQALAPGRVQMQLVAAPSRTLEFHDVEGEACVVSVVEVELRPWLGILGLRELSRVDGVGASARPLANAEWLTPRPGQKRRFLGLLVRGTRTFSLAVPADASQQFLVVPSRDGPSLTGAPI
jgi:hypothetical protein